MLYGIGINDVEYPVRPGKRGETVFCPYYRVWEAMLRRCYFEPTLARQPTYRDASVCDEWLRCSVFTTWMKTQQWENKNLDKDLLNWRNKVYSPETCLFINDDINNLLVLARKARGQYPLGVTYHKASKKFMAQIMMFGKKHYLGLFTDFMAAHKRYQLEKLRYISMLADKENDPEVERALRALW